MYTKIRYTSFIILSNTLQKFSKIENRIKDIQSIATTKYALSVNYLFRG